MLIILYEPRVYPLPLPPSLLSSLSLSVCVCGTCTAEVGTSSGTTGKIVSGREIRGAEAVGIKRKVSWVCVCCRTYQWAQRA